MTAEATAPEAAPAERGPELRIHEIGLRLPGAGAGFGRRVASRALELVAERLPAFEAGELERIQLRVPVRSTSESELCRAIADAIVAAVERRR